jgi:hypothetical protein
MCSSGSRRALQRPASLRHLRIIRPSRIAGFTPSGRIRSRSTSPPHCLFHFPQTPQSTHPCGSLCGGSFQDRTFCETRAKWRRGNGVPPPPLTFTVHKYTIGCRGFRCLASWRSSAYKCPVGAGRLRERPRAGLREMRARHPWPPTLGVRARRAIAVSARAPPIRQRKWWIADRGSGIAVRGSGIGDPGSGIGRVGSRGAAKSRRRIGNVTKTTTTTSDVSPLQPVVGQSLSTPFACLPFRQRPATERPIRQRGEPPARRKLRTCDEGYPD